VKTSTSRERAELFSLFAFVDGARQRCSFLIQLIRGKRSTRKSDFGVFTQPGSFLLHLSASDGTDDDDRLVWIDCRSALVWINAAPEEFGMEWK
jgi:hypothetical protein